MLGDDKGEETLPLAPGWSQYIYSTLETVVPVHPITHSCKSVFRDCWQPDAPHDPISVMITGKGRPPL